MISIITTSFNSMATIGDTLSSILSQRYPDFECIVVDGGSNDGTLEVIKEFQPQFNGKLKWISEPDQGIYDAMNKGIHLAKGDIIGFLNSDDYFASDNSLTYIAENIDSVDCVYGDLDFVACADNQTIVREWRGSQYKEGAFVKGWHPAHPTFYAKKECYDKFGGYDIKFDVSADFELMLRFIEKHKISNRYIPEVLVKMRTGGESTGSLSKILLGNKNIKRAFKKNGIRPQKFYTLRRILPKIIDRIKHVRI